MDRAQGRAPPRASNCARPSWGRTLLTASATAFHLPPSKLPPTSVLTTILHTVIDMSRIKLAP